MSKDHERLCSTAEAFFHAAMARLMVTGGWRVLEGLRTVYPRGWANKACR
jgi:hypothetical protein